MITADDAYHELLALKRYGWEVVAATQSTQQDVLSGRSQKLIAAVQTGSYGRENRQWSSPPGGLWMSWREQFPRVEGLTLAVSLATARCLGKLGLSCWLRWPNDVMIGSRKLAGCLVDAKLVHGQWDVVIGLGLNVKTDFSQASPEIASIATSLELQGLSDLSLVAIAQELEAAWTQVKIDLKQHGFAFLRQECQSLMFAGQSALLSIQIDHQTLQTRFAGLSEDGALLLEDGQKLYGCQHLRVVEDTSSWPTIS